VRGGLGLDREDARIIAGAYEQARATFPVEYAGRRERSSAP